MDFEFFGKQAGVQCSHIAVACCLLSFCMGCGSGTKSDHLKNLVPVRGSVVFKGQSLPGAIVTFHSDDPSMTEQNVLPSAIVDLEGNFVAQTAWSREVGRGVPAGHYQLAVTWKKAPPPGAGDDATGPELLPKKYQNPKTSGLEVEVARGKSDLDVIELTP